MTGRLLVCGSLQFLDLFLLWAAALGFGELEELDSHLSYRLFPPRHGEHGGRHIYSIQKPTVAATLMPAADKETKMLRTRICTGSPRIRCGTQAGRSWAGSLQILPSFLPLFRPIILLFTPERSALLSVKLDPP